VFIYLLQGSYYTEMKDNSLKLLTGDAG